MKMYLWFILLDLFELLCFWRLALENLGPLDAQGLSYYICMIFIYPLIMISAILYVGFIFKFYRFARKVLLGTLLNIHVFFLFYKYYNHFIRLWMR